MEMLKIRADLEAKYKQKGMITAPKHDQAHKHLTARVNGYKFDELEPNFIPFPMSKLLKIIDM